MDFKKSKYYEINQFSNQRFSVGITCAVIVIDWLLLILALWLLTFSSPISFFISQICITLFIFHHFAILHECGHGNAAKSSWINTLIGHYASIFCFLPFLPWKYIHQQHHIWSGHLDKDPVLKTLNQWQKSKKIPRLVHFAWRSWVPLSGFLQHFVYWSYPLKIIKATHINILTKIKCMISVLLLPMTYLIIYNYCSPYIHIKDFAVGILLYLVMTELVNLPHHVNLPTFKKKLPVWEQMLVTRSCYYPVFVSECCVLNFNFHIEHHLYPHAPWYKLRTIRKHLKPALGHQYQESKGISWNIKHRNQNIEHVFLKI